MSKVESLLGTGTLRAAKTGLFGSPKSFEVKYQFQLTTDEASPVGQIQGFLRVDEKQKLTPGSAYILTLDDNRKSKLIVGKAVASVGGIVTYSISGETV